MNCERARTWTSARAFGRALLGRVAVGALLEVGLLMGALTAQTTNSISGLGPVEPIRKLHGGFQFTEGPAADAEGNVYFTDIPNMRIHKSDLRGQLTTVQEQSGHANGLMFDASGRLIKCEMDGQVTALSLSDMTQVVLAGQYQGKRFNAPNDLVIDSQGGIYFTDPHYRAPQPLPQGSMGVYYRSPDGEIRRLVDDLQAPNGVILSPDERTLYVVPTDQPEVMAYAVGKPGQLDAGRVFCRLKNPTGQRETMGDGATMDVRGNLYVTTALGVQVYSPQGQLLGILEFPEQPANVTFGGANSKTLFVTARTSVYIAKMTVAGHQFARK
jgi:gluconolactonase